MQDSSTVPLNSFWRWPALWNLGFRPFFLFGVFWSILLLAVWVAFQSGAIAKVPLHDPVAWHAHEMVFGYCMAIVAGFVLTASQNWTGIPGVKGLKLGLLVSLWGAARIAALFWEQAPLVFAFLDLAFLPALSWLLKPYLWQKSQGHNKVFFPIFFVLFSFNLMAHINLMGFGLLPARTVLLAAVYLVISMIVLVGGRVIPFFAGVVIRELQLKPHRAIELLSFVSLFSFLAATLFWEFSLGGALIAFFASAIHAIRWVMWKPWRSVKLPVLFILYIAYFWIPLGFLLRGFSELGLIPSSVASHAFTAGCIGTMIYGMITRVALGHTGRPILVSRAVKIGYVFITLAALLRVFGPLAAPSSLSFVYEGSGFLWIAAHLVYLAEYASYLCLPRADGRVG